jgi:capsule polysaccharide export protein KpsE/RkpR
MDETSELTATDNVTAEDLAEVIAELEQYRERLVKETTETAKRAKVMRVSLMGQLEPELAKIDSALQELRNQQANLMVSN